MDIRDIRRETNSSNLFVRLREHFDGMGRTYSVQVADRNKRLLSGGSVKTVWTGRDICKGADIYDNWFSGKAA